MSPLGIQFFRLFVAFVVGYGVAAHEPLVVAFGIFSIIMGLKNFRDEHAC